MCCLFGILDYGHTLSLRQREQMLSVLAAACEARGTDATGIAYNDARALRIYKRPLPGHRMHFHLPREAWFLMGHTRMATRGVLIKTATTVPFPDGQAGSPLPWPTTGCCTMTALCADSGSCRSPPSRPTAMWPCSC